MKLESIGKIIVGGWGDQAFLGILISLLDGVTPHRCYQYIQENTLLLHWAEDKDWSRYKSWAKQANIGDITRERIIAELEKHRPDILRVIALNQPESLTWLDNQIAEMKRKLGLE